MHRLILHHWDTDGICSAALLYNEECANITPKIGNYFLEEEEIEWITSNFEEVWIVDLALHENSLKKIVERVKVRVFDHHITKKVEGVSYINPIMEGDEEEKWPSASWIVGEHIEVKNLLSYLGVVGDWEERIKKTKFYPTLERFMEENNLSFEELHEMVYLIDANYKMGDKKEVEEAVKNLWRAEDKASFIMNNEKWRRRKEKIEEEIKKAIEGEEERIGSIIIKRMNCPYNIISTVARKLWDGNGYVIVINDGYFRENCQVYVRGNTAGKLIGIAVGRGYVAGGKKNVMGAIVPKDECEKFIKKIIEVIKNGG